MSERRLDIISKYPQKRHIGDDMQPSAVQKYRVYERKKSFQTGDVYTAGYKSILHDKAFKIRSAQLEIKRNGSDDDDKYCYDGKTFRWIMVTDGKHKFKNSKLNPPAGGQKSKLK